MACRLDAIVLLHTNHQFRCPRPVDPCPPAVVVDYDSIHPLVQPRGTRSFLSHAIDGDSGAGRPCKFFPLIPTSSYSFLFWPPPPWCALAPFRDTVPEPIPHPASYSLRILGEHVPLKGRWFVSSRCFCHLLVILASALRRTARHRATVQHRTASQRIPSRPIASTCTARTLAACLSA